MAALDRFVAERQGDWTRLESLLAHVRDGNLRSLSADDVEEMSRLYRLATSDLARARRDFPGDRVVSYLNRLVSSAYAVVYSTAGISWKDVRRWFAGGFPRLFRRTAGYYLLAALLFFGTFILSFVAVVSYPPSARTLLDSNTYQSVSSYSEKGELWTDDIPAPVRSAMAAGVMTNNIQVAMLAFAGGMLLGLGTAFILASNGLVLGAVFGVVTNNGVGDRLLTFVIAHGVIELSVICLAGGAGFMLADALLRPGLFTRGEALRLAAQRATQLLLGGAALLVVAGTIEGFISASEVPSEFKFAVGIITGVLLYGYWLLVGRRSDQPKSAERG